MKTIPLTFAALAFSAPGLMAFPFAPPSLVRSDSRWAAGVADFNRDGRADILVASFHELVWLRHTTGTSFTQAAAMSWAVPIVDEVLTPDIDGDGDADVVMNTTTPPMLVILRNDGNFAFVKVLETPVGEAALDAGAIVGDYDNDGDLDAGMFHTVSGETVRRITWAANDDGVFTLQAPAQNAASINWQKALSEDFNKDGFMDLVMSGTNASASSGTRSGVFLPWPDVTFTGNGITHMETGDIDRDGFPDLVLTSGVGATNAQRSAWCRWNGAGFDVPTTIQNHTTGRVRGTHLVDADEDGDLDAVYGDQSFYTDAANQAPHQILWAENSGGSFLLPKVLMNPTEASIIRSGDVDGDGDMDLAISGIGTVQVMQNTAIHRTAEFGSRRAVNATAPIGDICAADMDNDGEGDLMWSVPAADIVLFGAGHTVGGSNPLGAIHHLSNNCPGAGALAAGDLNHDGRTDAVIASNGVGALLFARLNGENWVINVAASLPAGTQVLEVADVDRDGNNDVLIGHATGIRLLRGSGNSTPVWTEVNVVNNIGPVTKICPVQQNASGYLELFFMTVETSPVRCRIYRSIYAPSIDIWAAPTLAWEGDSASSFLTTGDMNRDGATDVLYSVTGSAWCAAGIPGSFALGTPRSIPYPGNGTRCAETADFDHDGVLDLAVATGDQILTLPGNGLGSFLSPYVHYQKAGADFTRLAIYDYEKDGDMDIMALDANGQSIELVENYPGQFDLSELAMGEVIPVTASAAPVALHLTFTHGGRPGDAAASIRSLRFRLQKPVEFGGSIVPGDGLTTAEATALLSAVEVYNDAGEPMNFEAGTDALLGTVGPATSIGYLTVTPTTPINLPYSQTVRLWVRPRMSANAGSSAIRSFFLQHITDPAAGGSLITHSAGSTANHRLDPMMIDEAAVRLLIPGTLENWRFTHWGQYDSTGPAANDADPDNDGVRNLVEYYTGTNPTIVESAINTAVALTVLPLPTMQSPVNYRLMTSNAAYADPRVRMTIVVATDLITWNNDASARGGAVTRGNPTIQTIGGRTILTFPTGHTPQTKPKDFVRLIVEEM